MNTIFKSGIVLTAASLAVISMPMAVGAAYGPSRPLYDASTGTDKVVFNSIKNNAVLGTSETNFVGAKVNNNGTWFNDTITVKEGEEYIVRLYVHNNASSTRICDGSTSAKKLQSNGSCEAATAYNTKAYVVMPNTASKSIEVQGQITASNADRVWDSVKFISDRNFNLEYVTGSAKIINNANPNGMKLSDSIINASGATIGYNSLNGQIPGCFEFDGYVSIVVKPIFNITVDKKVQLDGTSGWSESVTAKPGQKVNFAIKYTNSTGYNVANFAGNDVMPKGFKYIENTLTIYNEKNPNGLVLANAGDFFKAGKGLNLGDYAAGADFIVSYSAYAPEDKDLYCGNNTLTNSAYGSFGKLDGVATSKYGVVKDTAVVQIKSTKDCDPSTPPKLPQTGPGEVAMTVLAVGATATAGAYYIRSRKLVK